MRNGILSLLALVVMGTGWATAQAPYAGYPPGYAPYAPGYPPYAPGYGVPMQPSGPMMPVGYAPPYAPGPPGWSTGQPAQVSYVNVVPYAQTAAAPIAMQPAAVMLPPHLPAPPAPPITNPSPGAGMWYEDQPAAEEHAAAPPARRWGFLASWARRDPQPANGPVQPAGLAVPTHPVPAPEAACAPPPPLPEPEPPDLVPHGHHLYGNAEALIWWVQRAPTPVLATTGTATNPTAQPLVKDNNFDDRERTGVRATMGVWLDHEETLGLEGSGLYLIQRNPTARFASDGNQSLARPFLNDITGNTEAYVLGGPGQTGGIDIETMSRLWGAEANLRKELLRGCYYHFDVLGGFRFLELDESLVINDATIFGPGTALAGSTFASTDNFGTRNQFYGGQIGAEAEFHVWHLDLGLYGKVALGGNAQTMNITGATGVQNPDGTQNIVGNGLYTQGSNIGHYTHSEFAILPEVGLNVGLQLTPHVRATAGYSFLFLNHALRPGNQIDQAIDPGLIPALGGPGGSGLSRPAAMFHESDFTAQGLSAGLELRY
jgi:hypothetical protein